MVQAAVGIIHRQMMNEKTLQPNLAEYNKIGQMSFWRSSDVEEYINNLER